MQSQLDNFLEAYQGGSIYDFDNEILLTWYPQRIISNCQKKNSLLELGLGHGYTSKIFSEFFAQHQILEGSLAVIENFIRKFPDFEPKITETYFEEFSTVERFDVIVMGFILEHVDDPVAIIKRYKQFLAPGGKMFVAVPNAEVLNRRLGHLAGMLPDVQSLSAHDFLLGHKRYYTMHSLKKDIEDAGCHIDKVEGIFLKPLTTSQLLSLDMPNTIIQALCQVGIDYPELSCGMLAQISDT